MHFIKFNSYQLFTYSFAYIIIFHMIESADRDISVYLCNFTLNITKANIIIKFPCNYKIEWQALNGKRLATSTSSPPSSNSQIQFNQVLEASTEMLYDNSQKYFYKKQTILMINLISKSRPDQVKLVGRISIDLSQMANKSYNIYSQTCSYKLTYCSINADITFSARMVSKSLSNVQIQNLDKSAFNDYISVNSLANVNAEDHHNNYQKYDKGKTTNIDLSNHYQTKKTNTSFPSAKNKFQDQNINPINPTKDYTQTQVNNGKGLFNKNHSATNLSNNKKDTNIIWSSTKKDIAFKSTAANEPIESNNRADFTNQGYHHDNQWTNQKDRLKDEIQYNKNKISDMETKISQLCRSLEQTKLQSDRKDAINKEKQDLINKLRDNEKRLKKQYESLNSQTAYQDQNTYKIQRDRLDEQEFIEYRTNTYNFPSSQTHLPKAFSPRISQTLQNQRILQQNQYIIRELQSSKKQLQGKIASQKNQNEQLQSIWKQKKNYYEQRITILERQKNQAVRQVQNIGKFRTKVDLLTEQKFQLRQDFKDQEHELNKLRYQLEDKQKKIKQLAQQLSQTLPIYQTTKNQLKQSKYYNQKLSSEMVQLKAFLQQSKKVSFEQCQKIQGLSATIKQSKQYITNLQSERRQTKKIQLQKQKMQEKLNTYNSYMDTLKKTIQNLQGQIQSCNYINKINEGLKEQIIQLQKKLSQKQLLIQSKNTEIQLNKEGITKISKQKQLLLQKNNSFEEQIRKIQQLLQHSFHKRQKQHEEIIKKLKDQIKVSQVQYEHVLKQKYALEELNQQLQQQRANQLQSKDAQILKWQERHEDSVKIINDKNSIISLVNNQLQNYKTIKCELNTKLDQMFDKQNQMQQTIKILQEESQKILQIIQEKDETDTQLYNYKLKLEESDQIITQLEVHLQNVSKQKEQFEAKYYQDINDLKQHYVHLESSKQIIQELEAIRNQQQSKLESYETAIDQLSMKLDYISQELSQKQRQNEEVVRQYNCLAKLFDQLKAQNQKASQQAKNNLNSAESKKNQHKNLQQIDNKSTIRQIVSSNQIGVQCHILCSREDQTKEKQQTSAQKMIINNKSLYYTPKDQSHNSEWSPQFARNHHNLALQLQLKDDNSSNNFSFTPGHHHQNGGQLSNRSNLSNFSNLSNQRSNCSQQNYGAFLQQGKMAQITEQNKSSDVKAQINEKTIQGQKIIQDQKNIERQKQQSQLQLSLKQVDEQYIKAEQQYIKAEQQLIKSEQKQIKSRQQQIKSDAQYIKVSGNMLEVQQAQQEKIPLVIQNIQNAEKTSFDNQFKHLSHQQCKQINKIGKVQAQTKQDSYKEYKFADKESKMLSNPSQDDLNLMDKIAILTKLVDIKNTVIKQLQIRQKQLLTTISQNNPFNQENQKGVIIHNQPVQLYNKVQIINGQQHRRMDSQLVNLPTSREHFNAKNTNYFFKQNQNQKYTQQMHNFQNVLQQKNKQVKSLKKSIKLIKLQLQTLRNVNKQKSLINMDVRLNRSQSYPMLLDNTHYMNCSNALNVSNRSYIIKKNLNNSHYNNLNEQSFLQKEKSFFEKQKQKESVKNSPKKIQLIGKILLNNQNRQIAQKKFNSQISPPNQININSPIKDNHSNQQQEQTSVQQRNLNQSNSKVHNQSKIHDNKANHTSFSSDKMRASNSKMSPVQQEVVTIQELKNKIRQLQQNLQIVEQQKLFLQSQIQFFQEEKFYLGSDLNQRQIQIYELYKINLTMREELTMVKYQNQQYLKLIEEHQTNVNLIVNKAQHKMKKDANKFQQYQCNEIEQNLGNLQQNTINYDNNQKSEMLDKMFGEEQQERHIKRSLQKQFKQGQIQDVSKIQNHQDQFSHSQIAPSIRQSGMDHQSNSQERFSILCQKYQTAKQKQILQIKQKELLQQEIKSKEITLIDQNQIIYEQDVKIAELLSVIKSLQRQILVPSSSQGQQELSLKLRQQREQNEGLKQQLNFMCNQIDRINSELQHLNGQLMHKEGLLYKHQKVIEQCAERQQIMHQEYMNSINDLQHKILSLQNQIIQNQNRNLSQISRINHANGNQVEQQELFKQNHAQRLFEIEKQLYQIMANKQNLDLKQIRHLLQIKLESDSQIKQKILHNLLQLLEQFKNLKKNTQQKLRQICDLSKNINIAEDLYFASLFQSMENNIHSSIFMCRTG